MPTYEDYKKATAFARFRFKYGLFVQILALIALCFLIYFVYSYGEELASHPLTYAARHYTVGGKTAICSCERELRTVAISNGTFSYQGSAVLDSPFGDFQLKGSDYYGGIRSLQGT